MTRKAPYVVLSVLLAASIAAGPAHAVSFNTSPVYSGDALNVATADMDRDGRMDVLGTLNSSATWFSNLGGGVFATAATFPTNGFQAAEVAAGDFDRDGLPDLVTANANSNTVSVFLNRNGTLTQPAGSPVAAGSGPNALTVADLNRDGKLDILVADIGPNPPAPDVFTLLLGNGSGGFTAAPTPPSPVGSDPLAVIASDLTGDGAPEIVATNFNSRDVTVLRNDGSGGFTAVTGSPYAANTDQTDGVAAGDLEGDGDKDLVIGGFQDFGRVYLNNGDGTFLPIPGVFGFGRDV